MHPLQKGTATHSSIIAGEFHGQRNLVGYSPLGHKEWDTEQLPLMEQELYLYLGPWLKQDTLLILDGEALPL